MFIACWAVKYKPDLQSCVFIMRARTHQNFFSGTKETVYYVTNHKTNKYQKLNNFMLSTLEACTPRPY